MIKNDSGTANIFSEIPTLWAKVGHKWPKCPKLPKGQNGQKWPKMAIIWQHYQMKSLS